MYTGGNRPHPPRQRAPIGSVLVHRAGSQSLTVRLALAALQQSCRNWGFQNHRRGTRRRLANVTAPRPNPRGLRLRILPAWPRKLAQGGRQVAPGSRSKAKPPSIYHSHRDRLENTPKSFAGSDRRSLPQHSARRAAAAGQKRRMEREVLPNSRN